MVIRRKNICNFTWQKEIQEYKKIGVWSSSVNMELIISSGLTQVLNPPSLFKYYCTILKGPR